MFRSDVDRLVILRYRAPILPGIHNPLALQRQVPAQACRVDQQRTVILTSQLTARHCGTSTDRRRDEY